MLFAAGGLGFGLVGSGVRAAFTDSATATESITVGTFGILLSSTTPGVVVGGSKGAWTLTLNSPAITSSVAGNAPIEFTVTGNGSIPAIVHVAKGAAPASPFSDLMTTPPANVTLANGAHQDYNGGIAWTTLSSADESKSATVVYTITATDS